MKLEVRLPLVVALFVTGLGAFLFVRSTRSGPDDRSRAPASASEAKRGELLVPGAIEPQRAERAGAQAVAAELGSATKFWHGRVLDADSGQPIAGARLHFKKDRARKKSERTSWKSGGDGRFPPVPMAGNKGLALVGHPEYSLASFRASSAHRTVELERIVSLTRAAALEVRVYDATGRGRAGVHVRASANQIDLVASTDWNEILLTLDAPSLWNAKTDSAGLCRFERIPAGCSLSLELIEGPRATKHYPEALELAGGERRKIDWMAWPLGTGCQVHGAVVEADGSPAPDIDVQLGSAQLGHVEATQRTDAQGRFVFEDVPASAWVVMAAMDARDVACAPMRVDVAPDTRRHDITLRLVRDLYIRGVVVGPDGIPVPGCTISGRRAEPGFERETASGRDGAFALGPLLAGEYELETELLGANSRFVGSAPRLMARAGEDGVKIRLPGAGTISGRVRPRQKGSPAVVSLISVLDAVVVSNYITAQNGKFSFAHLTPGTYTLIARGKKDARIAIHSPVFVVAGMEVTTNIVLAQGAWLIVDLPRAGGYGNVELHAVNRLLAREWLDPGDSLRVVVPPGEILCRVYGEVDDVEISTQTLSVIVAAGEAKRIELLPLPLDER